MKKNAGILTLRQVLVNLPFLSGNNFGRLTDAARRHGYGPRAQRSLREAYDLFWSMSPREARRAASKPLRAPHAWVGSIRKLLNAARTRGREAMALRTLKRWTPVLHDLGFLTLFSAKVKTPEGWKSVDSVWAVARNDEVDAFAQANRTAKMAGFRCGLTGLIHIRKAWSILTTQRNSLRSLLANLLVRPTRIPPQFVPVKLSPAQENMRSAFHALPFEKWWREHGAEWRVA